MPDASGAVDLSAPTPNYDSLPPEVQDDLAKMAEANPPDPAEPEKRRVFTAFVVFMTEAGEVQVAALSAADLINPALLQPPEDLVYGMAAAIQKDILAGTAAQTTVGLQMQNARAMAEQMQGQQIASQLNLPGMRA